MSMPTLVQVISGAGTPVARHGRVMAVPSIVLNTWGPYWMVGSTGKKKDTVGLKHFFSHFSSYIFIKYRKIFLCSAYTVFLALVYLAINFFCCTHGKASGGSLQLTKIHGFNYPIFPVWSFPFLRYYESSFCSNCSNLEKRNFRSLEHLDWNEKFEVIKITHGSLWPTYCPYLVVYACSSENDTILYKYCRWFIFKLGESCLTDQYKWRTHFPLWMCSFVPLPLTTPHFNAIKKIILFMKLSPFCSLKVIFKWREGKEVTFYKVYSFSLIFHSWAC